MAQTSITPNCNVSGTVFTSVINQNLAAINSMNSGPTAPSFVEGKLWLDTASTDYIIKVGKGSSFVPLFELNSTGPKLTVTSAEVSGNLQVSGDINSTSDERVKANLQPITEASYKLLTLTGYTYDRTDIQTLTQAGLIAQQVEAVLPEAVTDSKSGLKTLNYNAVIALLVEALKETIEKVSLLEKQVKEGKTNV